MNRMVDNSYSLLFNDRNKNYSFETGFVIVFRFFKQNKFYLKSVAPNSAAYKSNVLLIAVFLNFKFEKSVFNQIMKFDDKQI